MNTRVLLIFFGIIVFSGKANAQFLGDIFFEVPSIAAPSGEEVVLEVAAFAGSQTFGSADITVSYDSRLFEAIDVDFPIDISGVYEISRNGDISQVRIVSGNGVSVVRPTGISTIAIIKGIVKADSGQSVNIDSSNNAVFLADRSEITNSSFGAEIIVSSSTTSAKLKGYQDIDISGTFVANHADVTINDRTSRLVRPGNPVVLAQEDGTYVNVISLQPE